MGILDVENGLITTCLKILFEELIRSPSQKASLDFLAKQFPKLPRQHNASSGTNKSMPRLLWKDGITTITELTELQSPVIWYGNRLLVVVLYTTVQYLRTKYVAATESSTTMTQTSNPSTEDTTMSDTNESSYTSYKGHHEPKASERNIKFAFKTKKNEIVDYVAYHCKLLLEIKRQDNDAIFFDDNAQSFNPGTIKDLATKFNYETLQRKHFQLICISHKISTKLSLTNLKNKMRNALSNCHATLTMNMWKTMDIRDVGWFLELHPRFHNRDNIKQQLQKLLIKKNSPTTVPSFRLYSKGLTNNKPLDPNRIVTQAIHLECESQHLHERREMIHSLYSTNNASLPGKFIPMNFPHIQSKNEYSSLIRQQHSYMENHRNITLFEITPIELEKQILHIKTPTTINAAIQQCKAITWLSPNRSSDTHNQWNLSTTKNDYYSACQAIQNIIIFNLPNSRANIPTQLSPTTISPSTISPTTRNYLNALTANISPQTSQTRVSPTTHHTVATTNVSSITTPTLPKQSSIQTESMKKYISNSIETIKNKFKNLQNELHQEFKTPLSNNQTMSKTDNELEFNIATELSKSISTIKHDLESFCLTIQKN